MAQWQDGNWHPAVIVAMQNGMFGVDWVNPALGQSSWVHLQQVQVQAAMMPPPGMMPPGTMPSHMGMPMTPPMHGAPHKGAPEVHAKNANHGHAMDTKQAPPTFSIGTHVIAQWQDGNWHPGRVSAVQNGMIGVDWDNAKLGASTWVQTHQVRVK
jgi:hypothetical protein